MLLTVKKMLGFENGKSIHMRYYISQIFPIVLSLLLLRFFHATDLRLIGGLGDAFQFIHAVQYNLTVFAQFIGTAGLTVIITLWPRFASMEDHSRLLKKVVGATLSMTLTMGFLGFIFRNAILNHFHVSAEVFSVARLYFTIGLVNMVLFAWQLSLDGALLAVRKQKITLLNIAILSSCNLITDLIAVHAYQMGIMTQRSAACLFISGTTLWLTVGLFISYVILGKKVRMTIAGSLKYPRFHFIWGNEILIAMIRSFAPLWFAYQIGGVQALGTFLVVYQSSLHIAYVAALPLQGGLPIAVRECGEFYSGGSCNDRQWLRHVTVMALFPSMVLLLFAMIFGEKIITTIFALRLSAAQSAFLPYFFLGCLIGQIGHVVSVPLRARLRNQYITVCLVASELLMNNIGFMVLNHYGLAKPLWLGLLTVAYALTFLVIMTLSLGLSSNKMRQVPRTCLEVK